MSPIILGLKRLPVLAAAAAFPRATKID